jgi:hypothetical protein
LNDGEENTTNTRRNVMPIHLSCPIVEHFSCTITDTLDLQQMAFDRLDEAEGGAEEELEALTPHQSTSDR